MIRLLCNLLIFFSYWIIKYVSCYGLEIFVDHPEMRAKDGKLNVTPNLHALPATRIGLLITKIVV